MQLSNSDIQIIIKTLTPKFQAYTYIDSDFIQATLDSFLNKSLTVYNKPYIAQKKECQTEPRLYVATKVENYIYYVLVQAALIDKPMMTTLLNDKAQLAESLCQKYALTDAKVFLKKAISLYDARLPFDTFLEEQAKLMSPPPSLNSPPNNPSPNIESESSSPKDSLANANPYALCCAIVGEKQGSGECDEFIQLGRRLKILNIINSGDNIPYEMYILLRFGFINGSIFTKSCVKLYD